MPRQVADIIVGPALGALIGGAAFALSLGLEVVDPQFIDWVMYGDVRIHFLGWHTYRGAPWEWPLGANPFLGYPVGTSVALTDSLPVFAVFFKALDPLLPTRFQYIGLWLLVCFVLQGAFGALLMRRVTTRIPLQALGSALFVLAPVLLHRTGHPALTAHWLLLAALWLHAREVNLDHTGPGATGGWMAIVAVAAATHAYLAFMVMALAAAHFVGRALVCPRATARAAFSVAVLAGVAGLVSWQAGYFIVESAGDLDTGDFGNYSMDLRAPLVPLSRSSTLGSRLLPSISEAPEVYAYAGLGVLLIVFTGLVAVIVARPPVTVATVKRHGPTVLAVITLAVMAVGPVIKAGETTLAAYDPSWWGPLTIFRANHRLFWPALYALTFVGLAVVCRLRPLPALTVITAAVVLQAVDVGAGFAAAQRIRAASWRMSLDSEFWRLVPPHVQRLIAVPPNMCAVERTVDFEPLALIAGDFRIPVNAGLAARFGVVSVRNACAALSRQVAAGALDDETLYVFQRDYAAAVLPRLAQPLVCLPVDGYVACTTRNTYARWQDVIEATAPVLPSFGDFLNGYADLDEEYERMQRPVTHLAGTREERVGAIRMYLVYRLTGCTHSEARDKLFRTMGGEREPRACGNPLFVRSGLPGPEDALTFRRELDAELRARGRPLSEAHIDLEGEAVWLLAYARARLDGASDDAAQDAVRVQVSRAAGR